MPRQAMLKQVDLRVPEGAIWWVNRDAGTRVSGPAGLSTRAMVCAAALALPMTAQAAVLWWAAAILATASMALRIWGGIRSVGNGGAGWELRQMGVRGLK